MATARPTGYARIVCDRRILGGVPIIRGTRVPVRAIAFLWRTTGDKTRILHDYPSLAATDLDEAIRFYEEHRADIDADLADEQDGEDYN